MLLILLFEQKAKVSSMFVGTRDKCLACTKTVYPTEKVICFYSILADMQSYWINAFTKSNELNVVIILIIRVLFLLRRNTITYLAKKRRNTITHKKVMSNVLTKISNC